MSRCEVPPSREVRCFLDLTVVIDAYVFLGSTNGMQEMTAAYGTLRAGGTPALQEPEAEGLTLFPVSVVACNDWHLPDTVVARGIS